MGGNRPQADYYVFFKEKGNGGDQWVFPHWTGDSPLPSTRDDPLDAKGGNLLGRWARNWATIGR